MSLPPSAPSFKHLTLSRRWLGGAGGVLTVCLLIAALPFLTTFGQGAAAPPEFSQDVEVSTELRESGSGSPDEGPLEGEPGECHSFPEDGNPSGQASAPARHTPSLARKGGHLPGAHAKPEDCDSRSLAGMPSPSSLGTLAGFAPTLPYFPGYPVFLVGDLPPPPA